MPLAPNSAPSALSACRSEAEIPPLGTEAKRRSRLSGSKMPQRGAPRAVLAPWSLRYFTGVESVTISLGRFATCFFAMSYVYPIKFEDYLIGAFN